MEDDKLAALRGLSSLNGLNDSDIEGLACFWNANPLAGAIIYDALRKAESGIRSTELTDKRRDSNHGLVPATNLWDTIILPSPFIVITTNEHSNIIAINGAAEKTLGIKIHNAHGRPIHELLGLTAQSGILVQLQTALKTDGRWSGELLVNRSNSAPRLWELTALRIETDSPAGLTDIYWGRDITNDRNSQRAALQSERQSTRAEMAAEIAHELNNYLSVICGNLELIGMALERGACDNAVSRSKSLKEGVGRITAFVEGLMSIVRPEQKKESSDLRIFVDSELSFLKTQARFSEIEFVRQYDSNLPPVDLDCGQLRQAFYILMENAADALAAVPAGQRRITISLSHNTTDNMLTLSVADNGCGMSPENYGRVLRQLFTTKKSGHGFNLLAVKRAVKAHSGRAKASPGPDGGACFIIELPLVAPPPAKKPVMVGA